jgi:hypothetical protein
MDPIHLRRRQQNSFCRCLLTAGRHRGTSAESQSLERFTKLATCSMVANHTPGFDLM